MKARVFFWIGLLSSLSLAGRYYDADLGLWISPDPARQFHSPYSYTSNPINEIDPDGLTTYAINGEVVGVENDGSTEVFELSPDLPSHQGFTMNWDEFTIGNTLNYGFDPSFQLWSLQEAYVKGKNPAEVALLSFPGKVLDVGDQFGNTTGYKYEGYWRTGRSAGNYFAGQNAKLLGASWDQTIRAAGLLHRLTNPPGHRTGLSQSPWFGEIDYAGRQIQAGYNSRR